MTAKAKKATRKSAVKRKSSSPAIKPRSRVTERSRNISKQMQLIELMRRPEGSSVEEAMATLGWQAHSVRGVISGVLKKKMGLAVTVSKTAGSASRYHLSSDGQ